MYAYVVRTAGARLNGSELVLGYALSRGVKHILLISHNDCGMTKIREHRRAIIQAFATQGWSYKSAEAFVNAKAKQFAIDDELEALKLEYHRLKRLLTAVHIAPLFLDLADGRVHIPKWYHEWIESGQGLDQSTVADEDIGALFD